MRPRTTILPSPRAGEGGGAAAGEGVCVPVAPSPGSLREPPLPRPGGEGAAVSRLAPRIQSRSNSATDSTCEVWGNMLITPAVLHNTA